MSFTTHKTESGFLLPSIHAAPPFFTQQPNPTTQATVAQQWTRLILAYARHRNLFTLRPEDADVPGGEWDEILRNPRINRRLLSSHLAAILADMVAKGHAVYEPPRQTASVLLYWRSADEWAQVLYDWANTTGQMNTILTFYEIVEPPVPSPFSGVPLPIVRRAVGVLARSSRAQIIAVSDGEGVRFLPGPAGK
ncbi:ESCRT-II complex vps25 subunit [Lenzites betulinus]|nr:ESCRT-II complex vps25 subunit [Lenzites betulinus]